VLCQNKGTAAMGVLSGIRVVEFEAIGPAPFGTRLLADMGGEVVRIDRPVKATDLGPKLEGKRADIAGRNRRTVALELKHPESVAAELELFERLHALGLGFKA
jgi:alpha-methylacyl-CoA racemase